MGLIYFTLRKLHGWLPDSCRTRSLGEVEVLGGLDFATEQYRLVLTDILCANHVDALTVVHDFVPELVEIHLLYQL